MELIAASRWFGRWEADAGALWNLDDLGYPTSSTTASGLPLLPGTLTFDEVTGGEVNHAILGSTPVVGNAFRWPARHSDGPSTDPDAPPMGAWLRLKPTVVVDDLPEQARVVARALQD